MCPVPWALWPGFLMENGLMGKVGGHVGSWQYWEAYPAWGQDGLVGQYIAWLRLNSRTALLSILPTRLHILTLLLPSYFSHNLTLCHPIDAALYQVTFNLTNDFRNS